MIIIKVFLLAGRKKYAMVNELGSKMEEKLMSLCVSMLLGFDKC